MDKKFKFTIGNKFKTCSGNNFKFKAKENCMFQTSGGKKLNLKYTLEKLQVYKLQWCKNENGKASSKF